jgi:anti-anti-sigma regulatory factor
MSIKKTVNIRTRLKALVRKSLGKPKHPEHYIKSVELYKGVLVVRLRGALVIDTLFSAAEEFIQKTKDMPVKRVLLDLECVTDADSSYIASLVGLFSHMKSEKPDSMIGLVNVTPKIRSLLAISRTGEFFKIYRSEDKAIEEMKGRK